MPPKPPPDHSSLTDYRAAWLRRGIELNAIYDALTAAVGRSPNGDPVEDLNALAAERDRYRRALESIREHEGKVCDQYELCEHRACQSSYGAWSYADGALGCTDSLGFDEEELRSNDG